MEDLHAVGGIPAVLKYLLQNKMIHGDCLTVTGKTMAENLAEVPDLTEGQEIIRPLSNPIKPTGHLTILKGNLAPEVSTENLNIHEKCELLTSHLGLGCCGQNHWQGRSCLQGPSSCIR
jgi:dihydroxy-acid dehydratase